MNIETILGSEWCARVLLTLASFLWQGAVLGVLAALAMLVLRRRSARLRYVVLVGVLALMAACPLLTYVAVGHIPEPVALVMPDSPPSLGAQDAESGPGIAREVQSAEAMPETAPSIVPVDVSEMPTAVALAQAQGPERPWASTEQVLVLVYALGVVAMLLRLGLGVLGGKRLRRRSRPVEESILLTTLAHSAQALGMRVAPALAYCQHVAVPTVVGIVRPMILSPMAFASGLTPQQVEFLLLHELAHIRRFDHLVNIAQRLVEAFLFFHPAVWYVTRRIRYERELCCDDLVVKQGGEARAYAESLIAAATIACQGRLAPAGLAALSATDNPSQLRRRVQRLLGSNEPRVRLVHGGWTISAMMLLVAVIAVAQVNTPVNKAQPAQSQTAEPAQQLNALEQAQTQEQPAAAEPQEATELAQVAEAEESQAPAANGQQLDPNVQAQIPAPAESPADPSNPPPASSPAEISREYEQRNKLQNQIKDKDWWLRKLAIKQLVETKNGPGFLYTIIEALSDEDDRVKAAAATALGQIGDPDAINHLVAALKNDTPVRDAAADALTKFPQDKVMPILRIAATDEDETVYTGTVAALQRIDNPETLQLLVSLLPHVSLTDGEGDPMTNQIRVAFGKKDTAQVIAALTEASRSTDKAMRGGIAKVLCPLGEGRPHTVTEEQPAENLCKAQETVVLLTVLSKDTDRTVRGAAVLALGGILTYRQQYSKQPTDDVCAALASSLRDANRNVAGMAASSLYAANWQPATPEDRAYYLTAQGKQAEAAALGSVAFEALSHALKSDNELPFQRSSRTLPRTPVQPIRRAPANAAAPNTIAALGQLNDSRSIPVLIEALRSGDDNVANNAAIALGKLKEKSAIDALTELAQHPSVDRRYCAITTLRDIGDARAVPAIVVALKDPDASVRQRAAEALGDLGDPHAVPDLVHALQQIGENFEVCIAAATSLGKLKDPSAIAPLAQAFETASKIQNAQGARELEQSAIQAIGEIGGSQACDALLPLIARYRERTDLVAALGKTDDQRAVGPIVSGLIARTKDGDKERGEYFDTAIAALEKFRGTQAVEGIRDFIAVSGGGPSIEKAVYALARMPEGAEVLYEMLRSWQPGNQQFVGACALARRGDERARAMLEGYKGDPKYRAMTVETLQMLDAAEAAGKGGEAAATPAAPATPVTPAVPAAPAAPTTAPVAPAEPAAQ